MSSLSVHNVPAQAQEYWERKCQNLARAKVGGISCSPLVPTILLQKVVRWVMHHLLLVNHCWVLPITVFAYCYQTWASGALTLLFYLGLMGGQPVCGSSGWLLPCFEVRCDICLSPVAFLQRSPAGDLLNLHDLWKLMANRCTRTADTSLST